MTTNGVSKDLFVKYLEDFSTHRPEELKILVIDNAAFHSTKDVQIPKNIVLFPIPPYCPELNPAERVWEWMKDKIAMKLFDTLQTLENKLEDLLKLAQNEIIKSLTSYKFYIEAFYSVFNE